MYSDEERLEQHKLVWLTKEAYQIIKKEKRRLKNENRNVSMAKLINNLILEKYARCSLESSP